MNILTVDTASETMRLGLAIGDEENPMDLFCERMLLSSGMHSEHLVPEMIAMCSEMGITLKDLSLLVCTSGPGSFTGLRVGMSALKGIALGGNIPLVSIPTMDAIQKAVGFFPGAVVPVIDARKARFYSTIFVDGKRMCPDLDCQGSEVAELLEGYEMALVTGPDAVVFAPSITPYSGKLVVDTIRYRSLTQALVELGLKRYHEIGADDIGTGPEYVRRSDAEIALEEKIKRQEEERNAK
ncbi:MAG: tRNA (adenosine(37)-N6)-threonylcarbamoyltransferase complex dimerization subunit type 1 TsaB [Sphaerochaeta sp.]|jgi:tRNA threonylcarbamoyladenosine biosynthesis protein TsaB|nr:tRNA (adenosine(37)-N6)-threonylcarbamoyltransferase complex dimerization subunit type 1 TsaB [Sphaerochaeta sp.]